MLSDDDGVRQFALRRQAEERVVRHRSPKEIGEARGQRKVRHRACDWRRLFKTKQEVRRQQNTLQRVSYAAIEAAFLAQKHAQIAFHFIGHRGTPKGARQKMDQHMMRRVFGFQLVARLGRNETSPGLGIFQAVFDALFRRRQILLRMQWRKKQRLRGVVKALAARAVGR